MSGFVFGRISDEALLGKVAYGGAANPGSDGIAVDRDGNVYLSHTLAGGVATFARKARRGE